MKIIKNPSKLCFILSAVCFILFAILFSTSSLQAANSKPLVATEALKNTYRQAVTAPLNQAANEATDPDLMNPKGRVPRAEPVGE